MLFFVVSDRLCGRLCHIRRVVGSTVLQRSALVEVGVVRVDVCLIESNADLSASLSIISFGLDWQTWCGISIIKSHDFRDNHIHDVEVQPNCF